MLTPFDISPRLSKKLRQEGACIVQTSSINHYGYGHIWDSASKRVRRTSRYVYEALVGPIPEGLHLDHLCRVRACVEPAHLEPVTNRENTMRGLAPARMRAAPRDSRGHVARAV